ncbi:MAG: hypothetical protein AAFY71_23180 [Bacteroidota bacterium]
MLPFHGKPAIFLTQLLDPQTGLISKQQAQKLKSLASFIEGTEDSSLLKSILQGEHTFRDYLSKLQTFGLHRKVWILHLQGNAQEGLFINYDKENIQLDQERMTELIHSLPELKLIFIQGQVSSTLLESLLKTDISAVICSSEEILDEDWEKISREFYGKMSEGYSIKDSFEEISANFPSFRLQEAFYSIDHDKVQWTNREKKGVPSGMYFFKENYSKLRKRVLRPGQLSLPVGNTPRIPAKKKAMNATFTLATVLLLGFLACCIAFFTIGPEQISLMISAR